MAERVERIARIDGKRQGRKAVRRYPRIPSILRK
jgi:hypothetical protein